jgi:glutathione S-transferase
MNPKLTLVSHALCPYVQRAAIVLLEKGVAFERIDIDLANKPDWFLKISPLGKTPALLVDREAVFESAVICEYLDETLPPTLHPRDALQRAQHRGWVEFGSNILNTIASLYNASDESALKNRAHDIQAKFAQVEVALGAAPYFAGIDFSMVDAVFGPVFRYFDVLDGLCDVDFFDRTPKIRAWRAALNARQSVKDAAHPDYDALLRSFLMARRSALSARMNAVA